MAKSKYAPALFEVMRNRHEDKPSGAVPLPKWWRSSPAKSPEVPAAEPVATVQTEEPPLTPEVTAPPPPPQASAPAAPRPAMATLDVDGETEPHADKTVARIDRGRVELSFTPMNAAIVAGVLLIVLLGSYKVGHYRGAATTPQQSGALAAVDPLEAAMKAPPNPGVLQATPAQPPSRTTPDVQPAARPAGAQTPPKAAAPPLPTVNTEQATPVRSAPMTYVVLETFAADDGPAAEFAQKWLAARQVTTRLDRKGQRWRLISAGGFASGDEQKMQQYIDGVKALGKDCARDMARAKLSVYRFASPGKITGRDLE